MRQFRHFYKNLMPDAQIEVNMKPIYIVLVKPRKKGFEPSFGVISRVLRTLLDVNSASKTELSQKTGVNYSRFLKHLDWLADKKIVALTVERHKVAITLTQRGRDVVWLFVNRNHR